MENKKFLTEENYQKSNMKVKKIGNILMIIGASMFIIGLIFVLTSVFSSVNEISNGINFGTAPSSKAIFSGVGLVIGGFLIVPSLFIGFLGVIIRFLIGNGREIRAYSYQQSMPVVQEGIDNMSPTIGRAAGTIAKGIKEGINEADSKKD